MRNIVDTIRESFRPHTVVEYSPLADYAEDQQSPAIFNSSRYKSSRLTFNVWKTVAILEFLVISFIGVIYIKANSSPSLIHHLVPRDVIQYETRVFHNSIPSNLSPYQGTPTPELDALWEELYTGIVFRVSDKEMHLLPNKTARLPDDPDGYITTLAVFHNLHCLNFLRKTLYPEYYPDRDLRNVTVREHSEHCIDLLRQTSLCNPDTTPGVWQWDIGSKQSMITWDITHTCLNYDNIHKWASSRALDTYNGSIWVEGNPVHGQQ